MPPNEPKHLLGAEEGALAGGEVGETLDHLGVAGHDTLAQILR